MKARGNKLKKPNWLRRCVFDVTGSFEIAGSLGKVFNNGGHSFGNFGAWITCDKTFVVNFFENMN